MAVPPRLNFFLVSIVIPHATARRYIAAGRTFAVPPRLIFLFLAACRRASFRSLLHKRVLLIPTGTACAPFVQNQTKLHRPQAHFCRFRPASSFYFLPQSFSPLAFAQTRLANTNRDCLRPVCAKSNEITSPAGALLPVPHRLIFLILTACRKAPCRFLLHKHIAQNGSTLINVINTFMVFPLSESFFL